MEVFFDHEILYHSEVMKNQVGLYAFYLVITPKYFLHNVEKWPNIL